MNEYLMTCTISFEDGIGILHHEDVQVQIYYEPADPTSIGLGAHEFDYEILKPHSIMLAGFIRKNKEKVDMRMVDRFREFLVRVN